MYLGYRYTETRYEDLVLGTPKVCDFSYSDVVAFPFGHGLSYADFSLSETSVTKTGDREYTVKVTVTNNSDRYSGKYSIPVYISKPYGDYAKQNGIQVPSVELINFGKTSLLAPGASEELTITLDEKYFTSYDSTKDFHGYGLKSVQAIAEKYEGHIDIRLESDIFGLNIFMNCPNNDPE